MKKHLYFILSLMILPSSVLWASQTRVDSVGGLSLVVTDETAEINPFMFGNPAGLALIPNQNRFDLGGQWFQEAFAGNNQQEHINGTLARLGDNSVNYHGLILFPTSQWAVQGDGDYIHTENQPDLNGLTDQTVDRTRELFRTAYNFGPFTLGSEIQPAQTSKALTPLPLGGGTVVSGQDAETSLISTSGLLINFPDDPSAKLTHFWMGGIFATQVTPFQDQYTVAVTNSSGSSVNVAENVTATTLQSFGPEFYLEIPGTLQAGLVSRFTTYANSLSLTSAVTNQSAYQYENLTDTQVDGFFKLKNSLQSVKLRSLSVNLGGFFVVDSNQTNGYQPSGTSSYTQTLSSFQGGLGAGVEKEDDYMVGLQFVLTNQAGTIQPVGSSNQNINFASYQVSMGAEKWFSRFWAFRVGIVYENDLNSGSIVSNQPFFPISPSDRWINTTVRVGAGYKDPHFKWDFMLWFGQPSIYDSPNPNDFITQFGTQLATAFLF